MTSAPSFLRVLQVDRAGYPLKWITPEVAALHEAKGRIAWRRGGTCAVLRGGVNAQSGAQASLSLSPIIALKDNEPTRARPLNVCPPLNRTQVIRRDRHTCIYCGRVFRENDLTLDHIHPESRGGPRSWQNLAAACTRCNGIKSCRTPEEAGMPLLFVPYVPCVYESFILKNRGILYNQMEFLSKGVPPESRIWTVDARRSGTTLSPLFLQL